MKDMYSRNQENDERVIKYQGTFGVSYFANRR